VGVMVDLRLQQLALAQEFFAILLVILMAVVALLCCRIEGVVDIAFPDNFFGAVIEMFTLAVIIFDQISADAQFLVTMCPHFFIEFDIQSVPMCIVGQKSVCFCYDWGWQMPKCAGQLSCLTAIAGHVFVGLGVLVAVFIEDAEVGVVLKGVELAVWMIGAARDALTERPSGELLQGSFSEMTLAFDAHHALPLLATILSCEAVWASGAVGPVAILRAVVKHHAEVLARDPGPPVAPVDIVILQLFIVIVAELAALVRALAALKVHGELLALARDVAFQVVRAIVGIAVHCKLCCFNGKGIADPDEQDTGEEKRVDHVVSSR